MKGPLDGIRVIELAGVILGPYAGQILGDLGADVIKIEPPGGDSNRQVGPYRTHPDMAALFLGCNRNKRSVVLDLKTDRGLEAARALIDGADVFLHNFRPDSVRRLGLAYATLQAANPGLVYCATYGYGETGPYRGKGAYDDSIQAVSGVAGLVQKCSGSPEFLPTLVADKTTAMFVAQAVLAALLHRARTGAGQEIEVPMFEATTAWLMVEHLWGATFDPPLGETGYTRLLAAHRKPYRCGDGRYLAVLPYRDAHWRAFCELSGHPELVHDLRFSSLSARSENIGETYRVTGNIMAERSQAEWLSLLQDSGVPVEPVNGLDDLVDDPHLVATGFWETAVLPDEGALKMPRYPANFGATPASIRRPPPRLGEHSVEVLEEAGFDEGHIQRMLDAGETKVPTPVAD